MEAPSSLETLIEYGIIQEVIRPLMSGKEAQVFVVLAGGEECVAKVYKEASQRTFKHRSVYTEGRRTRNTRDQRAMNKRTRHGRQKDEEAWRRTEVDMIYRLRDAGVRVPEPINFVEGVLVMELVKDADGHAAPRLGDLDFSPDEARKIHHTLIREVVRMLCAGVIHGDLSDFNVLMTETGPVVIDFPQAVDPTHNSNAKTLLLRDVANLDRFLARFAPEEPVSSYGEEIWALFEANRLRPDTPLSGYHEKPTGKVDTEEVMALIDEAGREHRMRRGDWHDEDSTPAERKESAGTGSPAPFRRVVDFSMDRPKQPTARKAGAKTRRARPARGADAKGGEARERQAPLQGRSPNPPSGPAAHSEPNEKKDAKRSRNRRRRGRRTSPAPSAGEGAAKEASARSERPSREAEAPRGPRGPKGPSGAKADARPARRRRRRSPKASSTR